MDPYGFDDEVHFESWLVRSATANKHYARIRDEYGVGSSLEVTWRSHAHRVTLHVFELAGIEIPADWRAPVGV